MIRANVVNSSVKEIRDVSRQISSTYLRSKEFLCTSIELAVSGNKEISNRLKGKQNHTDGRDVYHQYSEKIKK